MRIDAEILKTSTFENLLVRVREREVIPEKVELRTRLTKNTFIKSPIISYGSEGLSPAANAIEWAKHGGLGVIHASAGIEGQVAALEELRQVAIDASFTKANFNSKDKLLMAAVVKYSANAYQQAEILAKAGVDIIILEGSKFNIREVAALIGKIRNNLLTVQVIAGNAFSQEDVSMFAESGAEGIKVGGRKSIVEQLGVDVLNLQILNDIVAQAQSHQIPLIFDDAIARPADVAKLIALGFESVVVKGNVQQIAEPMINNLKLSMSYAGAENVKSFIDNVELNII